MPAGSPVYVAVFDENRRFFLVRTTVVQMRQSTLSGKHYWTAKWPANSIAERWISPREAGT